MKAGELHKLLGDVPPDLEVVLMVEGEEGCVTADLKSIRRHSDFLELRDDEPEPAFVPPDPLPPIFEAVALYRAPNGSGVHVTALERERWGRFNTDGTLGHAPAVTLEWFVLEHARAPGEAARRDVRLPHQGVANAGDPTRPRVHVYSDVDGALDYVQEQLNGGNRVDSPKGAALTRWWKPG